MTRHLPLRRRRPRTGTRGQGLVEYAMTVPVFLFILLGMLEFGFAFAHNLTLEYGTREGARVGSALANGGGTLGCNVALGQSPNRATVDPEIIAAVQRVLTSPGSQVNMANIGNIWIYRANSAGTPFPNQTNVWVYSPGNGPVVDGTKLNFVEQQPIQWDACSRTNSANPDSIGVSLTYDYHYMTPLGTVMGFAGSPTMHMSDKTIMALNPTD